MNVAICQPSLDSAAFVLKLFGDENVIPELLDHIPVPITGAFAESAILSNEHA